MVGEFRAPVGTGSIELVLGSAARLAVAPHFGITKRERQKSTSIRPPGIILGTSPPDASDKRRTKRKKHFDAKHTVMPALRVGRVGLPRVAKSEYLCESEPRTNHIPASHRWALSILGAPVIPKPLTKRNLAIVLAHRSIPPPRIRWYRSRRKDRRFKWRLLRVVPSEGCLARWRLRVKPLPAQRFRGKFELLKLRRAGHTWPQFQFLSKH